MTFLKTLLVLMFCCWSGFAGDLEIAKEAFMNHELVQAAVAKARKENLVVDDKINAIFISESVGMCGRIGNYFVSVGVRPPKDVRNPESKSILARVILQNNKLFTLSLLDPHGTFSQPRSLTN